MAKVLSFSILALMIALLAFTNSSYAFRGNIVAAWLMEEGSGNAVVDFTGNHDDGVITGTAEWVDGRFGKALRFDGSTTYVQIPFNTKFQVLNEGDGFTFAAWIKTEVLASKRGNYIAGAQQMDLNGDGRTWMGLYDVADEAYCYLGNARTLGAPAVVDEWYHFAVVITEEGDIDTVQIYSNGKAERDLQNYGVETCEGDYLLGCHKAFNVVNFWEGLIDDVVLISKPLTESELSELMSKGVAGVLAVDGRDKLAATWGQIRQVD